MSMYLALSICLLFISLKQSVNGAQFLIIIFFLSFGFAISSVFRTVIVSLASIYAVHTHHYNHINLILTLKS